jgi:hypothetical protein
MVDACYVCRRTQVDLDRLNEEIRTRAYLSYFSNVRGQIDEQRRRLTFLQRLKDEESGDPHFRIGAAQVFADPGAYQKLMPWVDTLIEIARPPGSSGEVTGTIGETVDRLLSDQRGLTTRMEEGLNHLRGEFAGGGHSPLLLETFVRPFPVEWSVQGHGVVWHSAVAGEREPLRAAAGGANTTVDVTLHLCSVCRQLLGVR